MRRIVIFLMVLVLIIPLIEALDIPKEVKIYLKNNIGQDFLENYVKEPIINPILDSNWDSYDKEKAKKALQIENLPSVKNIIIYPVEIDNTSSSFRVILFDDDKFYSELTQPVYVSIKKNEAIELAKKEGIKEPFNILLTVSDEFFGWVIASSQIGENTKEGDIIQVSINFRDNKIDALKYKPIIYQKDSKKNKFIYLLIFGIILIFLMILYKRWRNEK